MIIGIIILVLVGLFLYIKDMGIGLEPTDARGKNPMQIYMKTCLEQVSAEGLMIASIQGGHISPQDAIDMEGFSIAVTGYIDKQQFADEISTYIEQNIGSCLNDPITLKKMGYTILNTSSPYAKTIIGPTSVNIQLNYPITFTKDGAKTDELKEFSVEHHVEAGNFIDYANQILSKPCFDIQLIHSLDTDIYSFDKAGTKIIILEKQPQEMMAYDWPYRLAFATVKFR